MVDRHEFSQQQARALRGEVPDSYGNEMMRSLLGERPRQQSILPYEGREMTHQHVDTLQEGRDLGHFIIGDLQRSQVSLALLWPLVQLPPGETYIQWSVEKFNPGIAPTVPEEAPFPQQKFSVIPKYVRLERRGISVYMTANAMNVPSGMARIESQLLKVSATLLNTFEYLTIQELVNAHNGPMFREHITLSSHPGDGDSDTQAGLRRQIEYDGSRFAALNRDARSEMELDMADVYTALGNYAEPPYALLYPQGLQNIVSGKQLDKPMTLKIESIDEQRRVIEMESMPSYIQFRDGSLAFAVKDHGYGRRGDRVQPLLHTKMIAEHYGFNDLPLADLAHRTGVQLIGDGYSTEQRDRWIYDVESDSYRRISFAEMFLNSGFVPEDRSRVDDLDENEYPAKSFQPPYRSAPPMYYWDRGVKKVHRFAHIDEDIIPRALHRRVGETIAALVQTSKGDPSNAITEGLQLVADLSDASFNAEFAQALTTFLQATAAAAPRPVTPDTFGAEIHAAVVQQYPNEEIWYIDQDAEGNIMHAAPIDAITELMQAIEEVGVPPYMASLGGLSMLARMSMRAGAGDRVREMGKTAKRFIDAAKRIYSILIGVFPNALVFSPEHRPVTYSRTDNGFGTFFSAAFLNVRHDALFLRAADPNNPNRTLIYISPFTMSPNQAIPVQPGQVAPLENFAIGARAGTRDGDNLMQLGDGAAVLPAHMRTPWSVLSDIASEAARSSASARAPGRSQDDDFEETDIFATGRRSAMPAGAEVPRHLAGGIFRGGLRMQDISGRGYDDMNTENARRAWDQADEIEHPLVRVCTLVYLTSTCDSMQDYRKMFESNILVPFGLALVRPGLEIDMYTLIVAKPGINTMFHAVTDTVTDFGPNVVNQTRLVTVSVMHGVVLKAEDNVVILPSRAARRYVGGGGVTLYHHPSEMEGRPESRASLVAMVTPFEFRPRNFEPMGFIDVDGIYGPPGTARFAGAYEYEKRWGLSQQSVDTRPYGDLYETYGSQVPNVTWCGESLNYNRTLRTPAKGHRRGGSHPGCRNVWMGISHTFPPPPAIETL